MKKLAFLATLFFTASAFAVVNVGTMPNGSGTPGNDSLENAVEVFNGVLHAPQYMPGYPTAATIWPRVIEVPCAKDEAGNLNCSGYQWSPSLGRGEYLFISPVVKAELEVIVTPIPEPVIIQQMTPIPEKAKLKKKKKLVLMKPKKVCK